MEKLFYGLMISTIVFAVPVSGAELSNKELTERVNQLEEQVKAKALPGSIAEKIKFSGALEAEANYEKLKFDNPAAKDDDSSDLALSKAELGMDMDIAEYVSGHVLFLWEEDDTESVTVDEGYIVLDGKDDLPAYLKAGKLYVPFGNFKSNMVSDSLPLELGETHESALVAGLRHTAGFHGAVYAFNGDFDVEKDDDQIRDYGAMAGYALENENLKIDIGMSYINNLFGSNGLTDATDKDTEASANAGFSVKLHKKVPGLSTHAAIHAGQFSFFSEYMTMLDDPEVDLEDIVPGTLASMGLGARSGSDRLEAWNIELGYTFEVAAKELTLGAAYQGVTNSGDWFPEKRLMSVASLGIFEETSLSLEYRHDEFENSDKADAVTSQLAIGF